MTDTIRGDTILAITRGNYGNSGTVRIVIIRGNDPLTIFDCRRDPDYHPY